jgi:hypothetical protein
VQYAGMCAALIRLRRNNPQAQALRMPWGNALAVIGILICVLLLSRLQFRQVLLMGVTALLAAANWWWATHRASAALQNQKAIKVTP